MLEVRSRVSPQSNGPLLILSDRGQFISEVRLLIGSIEASTSLMATSITSALAILREVPAGCAIVDHAMTDGGGLEAIGRFRNELDWPKRALPIILVSTRPTIATIRTAVELGIDEILATPMTSQTLMGRIRAVRTRARPCVITSRYAGPCRRRKTSEQILHFGLRRQQDMQGAHRSKVAREVHGHLLAYHAARGLLDLLSPNTHGDPDGDILEAASALFERSLTLRDARIEALARLAFALASDPRSASRDIALMTSTLEDLLMLLNRRLDRAARRIEANFDADSTQGTPEWSH